MIPDIMGWDRALPYFIGALIAGFAIGSIPFGVLLARVLGVTDPRSVGSGNIGASNMLRAGGLKAGVATLALDAAKGGLPALIAWTYFGPIASGCAGLGAFLGHCYSPWLRFQGGKGVATGVGTLLAWRWEIAALAMLGWIVMAAATRISSVASLTATAVALALFPYFEEWDYMPFLIVMALVLIIRHGDNIQRLIRGEENRLSLSSKRG